MAGELIETAQALLTATDTALSKAWRDEERAWRKADLSWRDTEREFMCVLQNLSAVQCSAVQCKVTRAGDVLAVNVLVIHHSCQCGPLSLTTHPPSLCATTGHRQQQLAWRQEDLVQRQLENARALWARSVEKNRCCCCGCCCGDGRVGEPGRQGSCCGHAAAVAATSAVALSTQLAVQLAGPSSPMPAPFPSP